MLRRPTDWIGVAALLLSCSWAHTDQQDQHEYENVSVKEIRSPNRTLYSNSTSFIFTAFNKTFILQVQPCENLLSSSFHILTYRSNRANSNSSFEVKSSEQFRKCIYQGQEKNDSSSIVSLNICRGLSGLIHTCDGDYEIQPHPNPFSSTHVVYKLNSHQNMSCPLNGTREPPHAGLKRIKKRSVSNEWNLETLVVVDSKMKEYHGENLEMYILTLMSAVSLIYKDPSIGNNINIIIVKLIVTSEEEDKGIIYPSASKTLRNFCRFQKELRDLEGHDTAILLTREDLCRYSKTCDTLGLAQSGMVCEPGSSCAVIEDNGLSAAFTVAHEIGHILGIPHDDDKKCNRFHSPGQRLNVMARMLDYNSYPHSWSECSRHFITSFLDAGYGHCLLTKSNRDLLLNFEYTNTLPGELYDMDYQCELVFGKGSRICPYMPVCKRLWCTMEDVTQGGCRTQHMPWADGTRCGPNKSCFHGECVKDPVALVPLDGQWGEWQKYGSCSRTCGGGVARSIRYCDSPKPIHGGHYCVGDRIRYKSCETQECPSGAKDFRAEQCATFNGKTFGFASIKENVRWVPHYNEIDVKHRCKLYCRADGTAAYFLLKEKAIDGTTCGPDTFDICINGKCTAAGCDHILNSVKMLDSCGVCGGDGSSCEVSRGKYTPTTLKYGYNSVIKIPAGASKIDIVQNGEENGADDNYLALKDSDGKYILNGNFMVSMFPKSLEYGGCLIDYSGSSVAIERINASKSLQDDLEVEVLTVGTLLPPDIHYEYTSSMFSKAMYRWHLENSWSPCNRPCQGEQYRKAMCVNELSSQMVSDALCSENPRPSHEARVCNPTCFLRWRVQANSSCSSLCGPGLINNTVECAQFHKTGEVHAVPSNHCAHIEPKPSELKECMGPCLTIRWIYGEWSKCSASCGSGVQHRTARCIGDESIDLPEFACNATKITMQRCNKKQCPKWKTGSWKECSVTCGKGWKTRHVSCVFEGQETSPKKCENHKRPADQIECHLDVCDMISNSELPVTLPPPTTDYKSVGWVAGRWSECSVSCGSGIQQRHVRCIASSSYDTCDSLLKPRSIKICRLQKCLLSRELNNQQNFGQWRIGLWGKCSKSCGGGVRRRQVICYDNKGQISDECNLNLKPVNNLPCNEEKCPGWKIGPWSQCSVTCGKGIQRRNVHCLNFKELQLPPERCEMPPPKDQKRCKVADCLKWTWSQWSPCSTNCSGGTQTRYPQCLRGSRLVEDELCEHLSKPSPEVKFCNRRRCKIHWKKTSWSKCSVTCGKGYKVRDIICVSGKNAQVNVELCSHLKKPKSKTECHRFKCSMTWVTGEWSQCSRTCGNGIERRSVTCHRVNAYYWVEPQPVPDHEKSDCHPSEKPAALRLCNLGKCSENVWKVGPWMPCSVTCGSGKQRRRIRCYNSEGKRLAQSECGNIKKPPKRKKCHPRPCSPLNCWDLKTRANITQDGEQNIYVRGRYVKIYCARMNTSYPQEFITLPKGEQDNYSEIYSQSLKDTNTCPYRGTRFENCACETTENINAGLTSFQRIAINISSLSVLTYDLAFSQTHKGHPVPYAESGDCYSKVPCPQGRFSLSLLGTGFIVSPLTKWTTTGNYSSSRIRWLEGGQVIQGKCGGYCARCSANGHKGLLLDVAPP